ncbi:hypothetical protein IPU70_16960 [Achromobacter sp. SD115]|uniref:hypothetical protein n=1 Tax=Achromobacter sp. SD115 TaxID=2782011 RepID=UPI001A977250|nr:hypothetical protein [Achromobacter sp. SD115]MBO1015253.1 hypothetical protein [Achromobacter sp. SD115]
MKKAKQAGLQGMADQRIRPLNAEEIHAVGGGAFGKKPMIAGRPAAPGSSTPVVKANRYQ